MTNRPGVLDVGSVNAGHDTTHLPAGSQDQTARQQRDTAARRYLFARFPEDDAAELAAILGLDAAPPDRDPGLCRCGTPLAAAAINGRRDLRRLGLCSTCAKAGETA